VSTSPLAAAGIGVAGLAIGMQIGDGILQAVTSLTGQQPLQQDETGFAGIRSLIQQATNWGDVAHATTPAGPAQGNRGGNESRDMERQTQVIQRGLGDVVQAVRSIPAPTAPNPGDTRPNGRP
jgi:hypothetical protein